MANIRDAMDDIEEDIAEDIADFIEDHPGLRHQLQNQALNIKGFNIRVIRKLIEELRA